MTDVIDSFIEAYLREFDFYQEAARLCAQRCEKLLDSNGIRAMVTFRAKRHDRLREKLKKRNVDKKYKNLEDVRADVVDLAGTRIAIYFPSDRLRIDKLIKETFVDVVDKGFPEKDASRPGKKFSGYHATHYRVRLNVDDLPETQRRYAGTKIEIQVASVLMHAWSEVEHDLIYKPASGTLSEDEYAILDELNGLVLSGEIALERLQRAVEVRTRTEKAFSNHYELAAFLYEKAKSMLGPDLGMEPTLGRVDVLLDLLRDAGLDSPDAVKPYLDSANGDDKQRPIADQIADRVLSEKPDLYKSFVQRKAAATNRSPYDNSSGENTITQFVGEFLALWIILERFFRKRINETTPRTGISVVSDRDIDAVFEGNKNIRAQIKYVRNLRNHLVHGMRIPDENTLTTVITELRSIIGILEDSNDPAVRSAIEWAKSKKHDPGRGRH